MSVASLQHPLLTRCGVAHGFGVRDVPDPKGLKRPVQVHGPAVARLSSAGALSAAEADAVVSHVPGVPVGIVTADCVPVLAATSDGTAVAAIHAGWRGLAAGVVAAGIEALRSVASPGAAIVAVVGPRIGDCCYEVDAPVFTELERRFGSRLETAVTATRPGHGRIDLGALVEADLENAGVAARTRAVMVGVCTRCDPKRFHSYRRDGSRSGRLVHHAAAKVAPRPRLDTDDSRI